MRLRVLATAILAAALSGGAASAAPIQLVEAGGAQFPFRSYVLTLPSPQSLPLARLHVPQQGRPGPALVVLPARAAKQSQIGGVVAVYASGNMGGAPIKDA